MQGDTLPLGALGAIPMDVADKDVHRDLASERGVGALMIVGVDPVGESPEALVVGDHT